MGLDLQEDLCSVHVWGVQVISSMQKILRVMLVLVICVAVNNPDLHLHDIPIADKRQVANDSIIWTISHFISLHQEGTHGTMYNSFFVSHPGHCPCMFNPKGFGTPLSMMTPGRVKAIFPKLP